MQWDEMEARQPRLAEVGRERLLGPGVVLVGTVRRDGSPRISPVEPWIMAGDLWLSMMWHSTKARDLRRDRRILVHSVITGRDGGEGEYKVRGRAREVGDESLQAQYSDEVADALGWRPEPGKFHLFSVDIADVTFMRYVDATGDQHVTRWPPGREFVRHATASTMVGAPEPAQDLLRPEAPASRL
jgi:Pyridoxamine 5'-phosphate oxidase